MDIRKIALYLSGKIGPDYKKYSRLEFYDHLKNIYGFWFDQLDFYWKQSKEYEEELYFLVLEYLYSKNLKDESEKSKFELLLKEIKFDDNPIIQKQDESWKWDYSWKDFSQKIIEDYGDWNYDKGELFEELCEDILKNSGFINTNISSRWTDGGVDISWDKEIFIWTGVKKLLRFVWQCKYKGNWSVSLKEAEELTSLLTRENSDTYQWALFFTNTKYQSRALSMLNWTKKSKINIETFILDWNEILDIINSNQEIFDKYLPVNR